MPTSKNERSIDGARDVLVEGDVASPESWQNQLRCREDEIDRLARLGILRKSPASRTDLRLDFSGILAMPSATYFAMPKIFGQGGKPVTDKDAFRALRCILRYQTRLTHRLARIPSNDEAFFDGVGSRLSLFLQLLAWTKDHGLHKETVTLISEDFDHVDWGDTIARGLTLHMRTGSVFPEYHGRSETPQSGDLATAQAAALLALHGELGLTGRFWISDFDPLLEMCRQQIADADQHTTSFEFLNSTISEADAHATKDHDKDLIAILKSWLESAPKGKRSSKMFGVNAFHVVWEDICRVALGATGVADHSKIASQPSYLIDGNDNPVGPQRPDHLFVRDDEVLIADAKWYRSWRGELPQLSDIVKQFMYGLSVNPSKNVSANIFLVPTFGLSGNVTRIGSTKMVSDEGLDIRFPAIEVIAADWDNLVDAYIAGIEIPGLRAEIATAARS